MSKPKGDVMARRLRSSTALFAALGVAACHAQSGVTASGGTAVPAGKPIMLTITSYNYTNRYIDQFFVNGRGGGNVFVSTPDAGGGKGSCCVVYTPGAPAPKTVKVKWQASGCVYYYRSSDGEPISRAHHFFKEIEAPVAPMAPANPVNFEVHFYPDGHVEAAITDTISAPRVKLPQGRADRSDYPDCPGGTKPTSNVHVETQR